MRIPTSVFSFLWKFIKQQPIAFFYVFITALVFSANEFGFPYFIRLMINKMEVYPGDPQDIFNVVFWPLIGVTVLWFAMDFSMRTQGFTLIHLFPKFRAHIRKTALAYVQHHSHTYFSNNFAGSIAKKIADLASSCQTLIEIIFFNFTLIGLGFIITFILMWQVQPAIAAILVGWFSLHLGLTAIFIKLGNKQWQLQSELEAQLTGNIVDSISNIMNVRVFAQDKYEMQHFEVAQASEIKQARKAMRITEIMRLIQGSLSFVFIMSIILLSIEGWANRTVTLGDFSMIVMLGWTMMGITWYISYQLTVFIREYGKVTEALTLISKSHDIVDVAQAKDLVVTKGEIKFDHVDFYYRKDFPVFEQLNLTLAAGEKVGLVGLSGSGKSTFVNLILRLYDLDGGTIKVDQQDISQVTQRSLREHIGIIPQDPSLFHRTLHENIRYGKQEASEAEILNAAKLAHCAEFIENLPDKYDSLVGERGIKLSGGQRQRIAIARAMLKNAPILILDEATSSLDSSTEKLIQESLIHLMENKTTLVIAHRLSTLSYMDRILVFDKGQIVEDGTQQELLAKKGHFAKLWTMQVDGFLPKKDPD